ncbi:tyrosine-type recombinase/integrase [Sagittula stellata]|nr:site-specific integrase [Sagittula stellata]
MASITKHGKQWRAQVARNGTRRSKVFPTRQEARDWAATVEADLTSAKPGRCSKLTFGAMLDRYAREVSPSKRGRDWEQRRIELLQNDPIAAVRLSDLCPEDLADWRDRRLREVAPGTVRRERVLLSSALSHARKVWRLIPENPMRDVVAPKEPPGRERLVTDSELEKLIFVAGEDLTTARARAVHAFRFALETGMRAGEIVGLEGRQVDPGLRVARLERTKNGDRREVPLSTEALRLLRLLPRVSDDAPIFRLTSREIDASFRAVRDRAKISGLTFHDSRHSAVTRLSRKLDVLALARMIGHRDLRMLQRYYNEAATDIAKRLD